VLADMIVGRQVRLDLVPGDDPGLGVGVEGSSVSTHSIVRTLSALAEVGAVAPAAKAMTIKRRTRGASPASCAASSTRLPPCRPPPT
jgi:hypothetical protein